MCQQCAKFCGSCAIEGLVGLVPWCRLAFVGPKFFLAIISCVRSFFVYISWIQFFSPGYFAVTREYISET